MEKLMAREQKIDDLMISAAIYLGEDFEWKFDGYLEYLTKLYDEELEEKHQEMRREKH